MRQLIEKQITINQRNKQIDNDINLEYSYYWMKIYATAET